jgi:hypothetical protein
VAQRHRSRRQTRRGSASPQGGLCSRAPPLPAGSSPWSVPTAPAASSLLPRPLWRIPPRHQA